MTAISRLGLGFGFFNVYTINKQLFMWDHGNEDKEPARESYILALSVSLQFLLGRVQFDAGNWGPNRKTSSFKKNNIVGFKVLKSP